jgi:hypothetical protein
MVVTVFMNSENSSLESSIKQSFENLSGSATECLQDFEDRVRSSPLAAVALGVSVGYLLRFFPVTFFVTILVRLLLFSLKPLILIFGAVKLYELVRENCGDMSPATEEREPLLDSPSGPPVS